MWITEPFVFLCPFKSLSSRAQLLGWQRQRFKIFPIPTHVWKRSGNEETMASVRHSLCQATDIYFEFLITKRNEYIQFIFILSSNKSRISELIQNIEKGNNSASR